MSILHRYEGILESGISLVHEEDAIPFIYALLAMANPELVIEFGTSWGGFTVLLHEALPNAEIHTFDNENNRVVNYPWFEENTKNIHFHKPIDLLEKVHPTVANLLKRPEFKLLYSDNGDKIKETEMYSGLLNSGDIFGVHDYDKEYPGNEIDQLLEEDFEPYYHEILENWTSRFWRKK